MCELWICVHAFFHTYFKYKMSAYQHRISTVFLQINVPKWIWVKLLIHINQNDKFHIRCFHINNCTQCVCFMLIHFFIILLALNYFWILFKKLSVCLFNKFQFKKNIYIVNYLELFSSLFEVFQNESLSNLRINLSLKASMICYIYSKTSLFYIQQ